MALRDYEEEFCIEKNRVYAAICIYHSPGYAYRSPINGMLEELHEQLRSQLPEYEDMQVAYVYETDGLMNARPFRPFSERTQGDYKDPCAEIPQHRLDHVFFMGMTMLEQKSIEDPDAELRMYIVTDEKFERNNRIVWKEKDYIRMNPRFARLKVRLNLMRTQNAGGDLLEEYIHDYCE